MEVKLVAFGIARDILKAPERSITVPENSTVKELLANLKEQYPAFQKLTSLAVAINEEYADEEQLVRPSDEVVLIPPVAGG